MSKRNLFVSFAESDGGHSYLAARAMLDPGSIAHLIFRTTVADSLDAVASGQANYAVVPAYNSITQWEGATLKALASGQFEIYAQVCMPTSYVLVAHKDYMHEFVNAYLNMREPTLDATQEDAAKIYTRFLSRIYVGAQADEQYRGRLIRPDLSHAPIELSRNPLRVLEEMSRTDLLKAMQPAARYAYGYGQGYGYSQPLPSHVSGGTINIGNTPVMQQQQTQPAPPPVSMMETLQAPAALVAADLLDAPGDPEGWDQPGSLGEIVALLRKLLVLLNVYSFGSPNLPENKTQYLLVGRRNQAIAPDAIRAPAAAPTRIMTLVRPTMKKASADRWLRPRSLLTARARDHGFVFDRPPLMLSPGGLPAFLFEGGKPKDGVLPNPIGWLRRFFGWLGEVFMPERDKSTPKVKNKPLRTALEKKRERRFTDGSADKFEIIFLGQYNTWCLPEPAPGASCWCCEEAHAEKDAETSFGPLLQFLIAALIALTLLGLLVVPIYCAMNGSCNWFGEPAKIEFKPPPVAPLPSKPSDGPPQSDQTGAKPPPQGSPPSDPRLSDPRPDSGKPATTGASPAAPAASAPVVTAPLPSKPEPLKPSVFHIAFFEGKANLTPQSMNALAAAAAQALQMHRTATLRVVALGRRERDQELWRRRVFAVKDELVRLGVPANSVRYEGSGPYVVTIRPHQPPPRSGRPENRRFDGELDSIPDPLAGDY